MIELNPTRFHTQSFAHQMVGTSAICEKPAFALFDEMGAGKSKQVVDAACCLAEAGVIDTVVILAPAGVRSVWYDAETGQITRHAWVESLVKIYDRKTWLDFDAKYQPPSLTWVIVSYEYVRQRDRCKNLSRWLKRRRAMLVCDESSYVKSHKAQQTRSALELRDACLRAVILNGTPIASSPLDLYSQFAVLDPKILGFKNFYAFRNRYARMGGYLNKQVVGYNNLEELTEKVKPYLLRRLKSECLDLPPKIGGIESETGPQLIEVPLSDATWKLYRQMREDLVAYLDGRSSMASVAAVKGMRLAQITSGFLGGFTAEDLEDVAGSVEAIKTEATSQLTATQEVGREKLDTFLTFLLDHPEIERVLAWCRFRPEIDRLFDTLTTDKRFKAFAGKVYRLYGGQSKSVRDEVKREGELGTGRAIIIGQPQAGGLGLTLTTMTTVPYISNNFSLIARLQSEDRPHRPGLRSVVNYYDFVAVGPKGQKTIDHRVLKSLAAKEDISAWSTERWREVASDE